MRDEPEMSNAYFAKQYRHKGDECTAGQRECPGHGMTLHISYTSDTIAVDIDGSIRMVLFDNDFCILRDLISEFEAVNEKTKTPRGKEA